MSEMVERVARALEMPMVDMSPGMTPHGRLELMARAAIEAMREPTAAMTEVGDGFAYYEKWDDGQSRECWQAMIDEALK